MKIDDNTPYKTRPAAERMREARCYAEVISDAQEVPCVLESFGGCGDTTRVLRDRFPLAKLISTESNWDTHTAHYLKFQGDSNTKCYLVDALSFDWAKSAAPYDQVGVCVDFNLSTIIRLKQPGAQTIENGKVVVKGGSFPLQVIEAMPLKKAKWIIYTDAAISKLHINYARYGCSPTVEDYVDKLVDTLAPVLSEKSGSSWIYGRVSNHSRAIYLRMDNLGP